MESQLHPGLYRAAIVASKYKHRLVYARANRVDIVASKCKHRLVDARAFQGPYDLICKSLGI